MRIELRDRMFRGEHHAIPIRNLLQKMYARFAREYVQYPKIYKHTVGEDIAASFTSLRGLLNRAAKRRFERISKLYGAGRAGLAEVRAVAASFLGYMQHCSGRRSADSSLKKLLLKRRG